MMRRVIIADARYARYLEHQMIRDLAQVALDGELRGNDPHPAYPIVPDYLVDLDATGECVVVISTPSPRSHEESRRSKDFYSGLRD